MSVTFTHTKRSALYFPVTFTYTKRSALYFSVTLHTQDAQYYICRDFYTHKALSTKFSRDFYKNKTLSTIFSVTFTHTTRSALYFPVTFTHTKRSALYFSVTHKTLSTTNIFYRDFYTLSYYNVPCPVVMRCCSNAAVKVIFLNQHQYNYDNYINNYVNTAHKSIKLLSGECYRVIDYHLCDRLN